MVVKPHLNMEEEDSSQYKVKRLKRREIQKNMSLEMLLPARSA